MDVTDNPVVRALLKEVLQNGQKVVVFLRGALLTVYCAATRAVLFLYDLTKVPLEWLDHWWGHALDWVVGHAGGCSAENLLFGDYNRRHAPNKNMSALEGGFHVAAEAKGPRQRAPASSSFTQQQQHQQQSSTSLFESSTRGIIFRVKASCQEEEEIRKVTITPSTTASDMLPGSLAPHVSKHPVDSSALEGSPSSNENDNKAEVVIMPFQLGDGEEEEASSFVPSSIAGSSSSRVGRPVKWSMGYLAESAEGGCGRIVGTGNFAKVAVTTLKTNGFKMAVKSIASYSDDLGSMDEIIDTELTTLQAAGAHPNVVDCFGYIKTSLNTLIMMPMIPTDLAELVAKVGPLTEVRTQEFMRQALSAVEYLHSKNILHRDLKPANMLLTEDETMLLADFGLATIIPPGETVISGPPCGTKAYMSPEQVGAEGTLDYTTKVDSWGLGVIAYELLHDKMPFRAVVGVEDGNKMPQDEGKGNAAEFPAQVGGLELKYIGSADIEERANILEAKFTFDDQLVSLNAKDFVSKLLERDVDQRLLASDAAEHPWLGGPDKATDTRTKVADAVAARESEILAEKARLAGGRRRGVRRRVTAPVVR